MVRYEKDRDRKREYIIVKYRQQYYYARASRENDDQYDIMAVVDQKEGRMIVDRANETSNYKEFLNEQVPKQ